MKTRLVLMFENRKFHQLRFGPKKKVLSEIMSREVLIAHHQRGIPKFTDGWLSTVRHPKAADFILILTDESVAGVYDQLEKYLRRVGKTANSDMVHWLSTDIEDHIKTFFAITEAQVVSLKLKLGGITSLNEDVYQGYLKLFCNFGPQNIFWMYQSEKQNSKSMRIEPLDVVILKGEKWPGRMEAPFKLIVENDLEDRINLLLEIEYLG